MDYSKIPECTCEEGSMGVIFCPFHGAADDMYEALIEAKSEIESAVKAGYILQNPTLKLYNAIRKAEGK